MATKILRGGGQDSGEDNGFLSRLRMTLDDLEARDLYKVSMAQIMQAAQTAMVEGFKIPLVTIDLHDNAYVSLAPQEVDILRASGVRLTLAGSGV